MAGDTCSSEQSYRGQKPFPTLQEKTIILVDDGIATGATMKAAIKTVKSAMPATLIVAIPVCPLETANEIEQLVDELICPIRAHEFNAVGDWYEEFNPVEDQEVLTIMRLY